MLDTHISQICKRDIIYIFSPSFIPFGLSWIIIVIISGSFPQSRSASTRGRFLKAKKLGNIALAFNFTAILVAFLALCFMVTLLVRLRHHHHRYVDYQCITIGTFGSGAEELIACP